MLTEYEKSTFKVTCGKDDLEDFDLNDISIKLFTHDDLDGFGSYLVLKNFLDLIFKDDYEFLKHKGSTVVKEYFKNEILDSESIFTGYILDVTVCSNSNINDMVDYCTDNTEDGILDYDIILFSDIVPDLFHLTRLSMDQCQFYTIDHHKTNLEKMKQFPDRVKVQPVYANLTYKDKIADKIEPVPACGTTLMNSFCTDILFPNLSSFNEYQSASVLKDSLHYEMNLETDFTYISDSLSICDNDAVEYKNATDAYFEFLDTVLMWDTFLFDKVDEIILHKHYDNHVDLEQDEITSAECLNFAFNSLLSKLRSDELDIGNAFKEMERIISDGCIFNSKKRDSATLKTTILESHGAKFTLGELGLIELSKLLEAEKYMIVGKKPIAITVTDCDLITSKELLEKSPVEVTFNVLCTNSNVSWLSKRYLAKNPEIDIVIIIHTITDKIECSIRTRNPNIDVSTIARKFNGGGHPQASGFTTTIKEFGLFLDCLKNTKL